MPRRRGRPSSRGPAGRFAEGVEWLLAGLRTLFDEQGRAFSDIDRELGWKGSRTARLISGYRRLTMADFLQLLRVAGVSFAEFGDRFQVLPAEPHPDDDSFEALVQAALDQFLENPASRARMAEVLRSGEVEDL